MKIQHIHDIVFSVPEKRTSASGILQQLRRRFRRYPWIIFKYRKYLLEGCNAVGIMGEFDPELGERGSCVVYICSFSGDSKSHKLKFVGDTRYKVLFEVFTTILHERRHLLQSIKAKACPYFPKIESSMSDEEVNRRYFSTKDEIDAHAYSAAAEVAYDKNARSETIMKYQQYFLNTDPVYKRFMKRMSKYHSTLPVINSPSKEDSSWQVNRQKDKSEE